MLQPLQTDSKFLTTRLELTIWFWGLRKWAGTDPIGRGLECFSYLEEALG